MTPASGIGRVGQDWLSQMARRREALLCGAFGLPQPIDADSDRYGEYLALLDLGLCDADVIAEPRYRRSAKKTARDASLARNTIHMAPVWRYADQDETGRPALILPVGPDGTGHDRILSLSQSADDQEFASWIGDLIAIPLDGGRPLSSTGHTLAIGALEADGDTLRLFAGPLTWLKAYLAKVRELTADTPGHLVQQLCFPLPAPDQDTNLVVEPFGLDWRIASARCVIPDEAKIVAVPDSLNLAQLIDGLMRQRERIRTMPVVRGPRKAVAA